MNPIRKRTNVLTKTFETMIGLASNIILQACQWYGGSKVCCLKSRCLLFFNCQKSPGPIKTTFEALCENKVVGMKDYKLKQSRRQPANLKKILTKAEFSSKPPMVTKCEDKDVNAAIIYCYPTTMSSKKSITNSL